LFATSNLDGPNTVWEMIAKDDIGNVIIEQIDWRRSDGRFTVATYGSGIFQTTITEIGDVLTVNDIDVNELTIYPNPTSDTWIISAQNNIITSVEVFNLLGKRVVLQTNNSTNIAISTQGLTSGIYIARVTTEQGVKSVKLIRE